MRISAPPRVSPEVFTIAVQDVEIVGIRQWFLSGPVANLITCARYCGVCSVHANLRGSGSAETNHATAYLNNDGRGRNDSLCVQ
jgi:hypothetical protein